MIDSKAVPWLLVEQGGQRRSAAFPTQGSLILGSSEERAGFTLHAPGVEATHCAIGCVKQGGWAIKDLGSQGGTFVNGTRVDSKRLALGDEIVIGSVQLKVCEASADLARAERAPAASPATGTRRMAGYVIQGTLGRGGMGEVVLALQESLNRHVAIKLLSTKLGANLEFVRAFHSEARAAAALNHPNVVVVHDVGEEVGQQYLAMEYMPGGSLEERVQELGRLPWREVLNILHDAASGLAYAESQGIVHRDIKPANLMIAASGAIKIADLGLALNLDEQGAGDSAEGRKTYGTPHFISPEQARGLSVDRRSDLYSLGASAYRLLSGRTPFQGETTREIVRARFVGDPPALATLVPGLPDGLHQLVHKLMQREPNQRFGSARELLSAVDLLRLRADHGVAPGADAGAAANAKSKSPRLALLAAGLVLVAAVLFFLKDGESKDPSAQQSAQDSRAGQPAARGERGNALGAGTAEDFFGKTNDTASAPAVDESDELRLLRLERDAVAELRRLPADLGVQERIQELEALAKRFAGTDTAAQALLDASQLKLTALDAEQASKSQAVLLSQSILAIKTHIGWPQPSTNPADLEVLLARIDSYLPPQGLSKDERFQAGLTQLRSEIAESLEQSALASIEAAEVAAASGDFEPLRAALEAAQLSLWPGDLKLGESELATQMRTKSLAFKTRLEGLHEARRKYAADRERSDRLNLALCLGPASSLQTELLNLELHKSLARIEATQLALHGEQARAKLQRAGELLSGAQRALDLLIESYARELWKRKTISVPRTSNRSSAEEAVGANRDGILVADAEGTRLVAWASFARSDAALSQLFKARLTRPWSAPETADIACLLCLPSLAKALELAGPGFLNEASTALSAEAVAAMLACFDDPIAWIEEFGELSLEQLRAQDGSSLVSLSPPELYRRVLQERQALAVLTQAVQAHQEGAFALCISILETLLSDYSSTLLVLMLSSGTP